MKVLSLFDGHYPYNIDLEPIYKFAQDFKADVIQMVGDWWDLAYLSHWNELSPGKWGKSCLKRERVELGKIIDTFRGFKPKTFNYFIGNHEFWLKMFSDKFTYLKDELNIKDLLETDRRKINVIPYNKSTKYGKLHYIHGVYTNTYHSQKTLMAFQANIRYGHTHDQQVSSTSSTLDRHVKNAQSCGCLCNRNPEYLHGKPNKWQHGFHIAYIMPCGNFSDYFVPIVKNRFIFADKEYK